MRLLFTLAMLVTLLGCSQSTIKTYHLINYVNNIALNTPGWDNNKNTQSQFNEKISKLFNRDLQDSNLLLDFPLRFVSFGRALDDGSFNATFEPAGITEYTKFNGEKTEIHFTVKSDVTDSLGKSLKDGAYYYITSYTKNPADSNYTPDFTPDAFGNSSHTISLCFLGEHHIHILKIESASLHDK